MYASQNFQGCYFLKTNTKSQKRLQERNKSNDKDRYDNFPIANLFPSAPIPGKLEQARRENLKGKKGL